HFRLALQQAPPTRSDVARIVRRRASVLRLRPASFRPPSTRPLQDCREMSLRFLQAFSCKLLRLAQSLSLLSSRPPRCSHRLVLLHPALPGEPIGVREIPLELLPNPFYNGLLREWSSS